MHTLTWGRAAALLLLAAGGGCLSGAPQSLAETAVPAAADLAGARTVEVRVLADPGVLPSGRATSDGVDDANGVAIVDLQRADGALLYSGKVQAGTQFAAQIQLPTKDASVTAVLHAPAGDRTLKLAVENGAAEGHFQ